jgi:hypothetical protein
VAALALLAISGGAVSGCAAHAGHSATATDSPRKAAAPAAAAVTTSAPGHRLISFRRVFGSDPLASTLTVYSGGVSVATLGFGGRNGLQVHRFQMPAAQLLRLRSLVRRAHLRTTDVNDVKHYIYWVTTDRGSYRLRDGLVPDASRPLIAELNAITDKRTG